MIGKQLLILWLIGASSLYAANLISDEGDLGPDLNFQEQASDFIFANWTCTFDPATQSCLNIPADGVNPGALGIVRTGRYGYGPYEKPSGTGYFYGGWNNGWHRSNHPYGSVRGGHNSGWRKGDRHTGGRHNGHGHSASRGGRKN